MKWMNWGWEEYLSAPVEIVDEIVRLMNEEQEEYERRKHGHTD